jgi:hypothetical protein
MFVRQRCREFALVEGTTAGRLLKKRGGDGGNMVILQSDRLAEPASIVARVRSSRPGYFRVTPAIFESAWTQALALR